jgi:hypothetical protein
LVLEGMQETQKSFLLLSGSQLLLNSLSMISLVEELIFQILRSYSEQHFKRTLESLTSALETCSPPMVVSS